MSYKEMFQHIIDEFSDNSLVTSVSWLEKYAKQCAIGAGVVVACGIAGWYVMQERKDFRQKATSALFETLQEYQEAERTSKDAAWSDVDMAVTNGASSFASTGVAGYFNALQSDVDQRKGDAAAARVAMHSAADVLPGVDPVKDLYAISAARMDLEQGDAQVQEKAVRTLQSYAHNAQSYYQDMAQYYLGVWYMEHGNNKDAHALLSELIKAQEKFEGKDEYSPWAQAAREIIDQVTV